MDIVRHPVAAACIGALLLGGVSASACDADSPATPPAGTAVDASPARLGPSSTPTPSPPDPTAGDRLAYEGDWEGAAGVYAAVAADTTGPDRQEALLDRARMLIRTEDLPGARATLDDYARDAGPAGDGSAGAYMLGDVLDRLDDDIGAIAVYERYLLAGGPLAQFARAERTKLLAQLNRPGEAEAEAEAVLLGGLPAPFSGAFVADMARAFEAAGDDPRALAWYARLSTTPGGDAFGNIPRSGAVKRRLGDPSWTTDYLTYINEFPSGATATDLLAQLDAAAVPVSDYIRGLVHYRHFEDEPARAAFDRAIAAGDRPAESTYYLAALDERAGDPDAAIANYTRVLELDPASSVADDALWWRGRLLESAQRYDEASASYAQLAANYPASDFFSDGAFRSGLVLYKAGNYAGAALAWSTHAGDPEEGFRARLWQGRAFRAAGDPLGDAILAELANDPRAVDDFYALRAAVLISQSPSGGGAADLDADEPDWGAIATTIAQETGTDPLLGVPLTADDPRFGLAAELEAAGQRGDADRLLHRILSDAGADLTLLYRATRRFHEDGYPGLAARAAVRLKNALPPGAPLPPDLRRLAYPLVYDDLVSNAAAAENVSPLLLLALVRQESFYDPDAGSPAGALGLTQVIPTTGESIAAVLDIPEFTPADLFRPDLSLRFGANYIGSQIRNFDGNLYHALAAYNGGPGTASNAIDLAGADIDLFVEELEFDETRLYVRLVMENYARYRQLYESLDRPSLAE